MSEQSDTGDSIPGAERSQGLASTTTVSDASLDKFARVFEASARRWEVIIYPSMLAFIVLAAYGFFLIYSMTSDVHRVTEQMDLITKRMLNVSGPMNFMTDMMPMGK